MYTIDSVIKYLGLKKFNTLTKYPSIQTYHEIKDGRLNNWLTDNKGFHPDKTIYITEKVDGTNVRIVCLNNDFLIGSREEFIYAKGDRIINPILNIVKTILPIADMVNSALSNTDKIYILYGELFGSNIGKLSRNYTLSGQLGFKMFDFAVINTSEIPKLAKTSIEIIASWREHDTSRFVNTDDLKRLSQYLSIERVPYVMSILGSIVPKDILDTYTFLNNFRSTNCILDNDYWERARESNKYKGGSEGVVIRNYDRSFIRKLRFEDYEKTLRSASK